MKRKRNRFCLYEVGKMVRTEDPATGAVRTGAVRRDRSFTLVDRFPSPDAAIRAARDRGVAHALVTDERGTIHRRLRLPRSVAFNPRRGAPALAPACSS